MLEYEEKQKIGRTGELLAARFLERRGYRIVERNYRKKWGEIDIIAQKGSVLHFVEVKASAVSKIYPSTHETYRPEENVRQWKKMRMSRAIRTYFMDRHILDDQEFEIDVIALLLDFSSKKAKIRMVSNIVLQQ